MQPDQFTLLERYHDGEASPEEAARVEALLGADAEAMEYLGALDEFADLTRVAVDTHVASVSFEGLWDNVQAEIAKTSVPATAPAVAKPGFFQAAGQWLQSVLIEHKTAWVTAGATACAVFLVMYFTGGLNNQNPVAPINQTANLPGQSVVMPVFHVDGVQQIDPNSRFLLTVHDTGNPVIPAATNSQATPSQNSVPVMWILPAQEQPVRNSPETNTPSEQDDDMEGIEITEEAL